MFKRKFYYISLNLGPAAGPVQAITIALQLPIIETRVTILLGLARADGLKGKTYADTFDLESIQFYLDSIQFPETISRFNVK